MRKATLVYLIDKDKNKILLGMKKKGFGKGRWNGYGGKQEDRETIEQTAIREIQEETINLDTNKTISIDKNDLNKVCILDFTFPHNDDWNQQVHVYFVYRWSGDIYEGEEMKPKWFDISKLPYDLMWKDDIYWLPRALKGEKLTASFSFNENDEILSSEISPLPIS